ncbi:FAD-dependent oxidoreductase [Hydrogenophaga sp. NFH-34]|uniref:FAD-dependent oxidoreductase n=1 Tax=Hydrogenophaga sp. NFH-34 TaxID=2744446 RepID=UPI001F3FFAE9|nr:FAD-dependent oxidoreductase [Hydrogenophaga sp. NFH-34]
MASKSAYDLIVVGAGAGGMATALCAAHRGLDVLLCEASDFAGGTTAFSAGTLWVPGNRASQALGTADSVARARTYLDAVIGAHDPRGLRAAFLESAADAVDFLARHTQVRFAAAGLHPDYLISEGAATEGRAVAAVPYDGRLLGDDFRRVRPPLPDFMVLGGMMVGKADVQALIGRYRHWRHFLHVAKLVTRHAVDRLTHSRGTRLVMGNALVARFLASLQEAGVPVLYRSRMQALRQVEGRVVGVELLTDEGPLSLTARCGVVLACGGLGRDEAWRRQFGPSEAGVSPSLVAPANLGEGVRSAASLGAHIDAHEGGYFWQPVSRVPTADGGHRLFPHLYLDRAKPGLIAVNRAGDRFTNEADSYHHFAEALWRQPPGPGAPAHLVCDARFVQRYGLGVIPPGTRRLRRYREQGYLLSAETLDGLAAQMGIPAATLRATVERFNALARNGTDTDWGKGRSVLNRFNGDAAHGPNPCLAPIQDGPFCALAIWQADAASSTGLSCDAHGRVLNAEEQPIAGLYAVGNDMASVMRGTYPGPGITLGPAITFGYRAATHAAASRPTATETGADTERTHS